MVSRRAFLAGTAGALAAGPLLSACSDDSSSTSLSKLTMMAPLLGTEAPAGDNLIVSEVNSLAGLPLDVTWVPGSSYEDKFNVLLASGQLPQVVVSTTINPTFIQAAEAGAFWELSDKLADYPNLASPNAAVQRNASINGKIYGLYRRRDPMRGCIIIRKDWLAKLGLSEPTTTEELYEVAKAFSKDGKYGMIIPKWDAGLWTGSPYDNVETWFGAPNAWGLSGDALVPSFQTDEFLAADKYLKKMIAEGLINKDFATMDSGKWNEPFLNGKGGIIVDVNSRALKLLKLFTEQDPASAADMVTIVGAPAGPDGARHALPTAGFSGVVAFSKQALSKDEDLDAALTVMDKLASKEGQILINNGIEGKTFTVVDGRAAPMEDEEAAQPLVDAVTAYAQLTVYGKEGKQLYYKPAGTHAAMDAMLKLREKTAEEDLKVAVYDEAAGLQSPTWIAKGGQITTTFADARIRYLAGQIDDAGLAAEITRWRKAGGDQIATELTDLYHENAG